MENFTDLGALPVFAEKLASRAITVPTAIQRLVIPPLLSGKSVVFRSGTGTGKTFAYLIPALQRLFAGIDAAAGDDAGKRARYQGPAALICAPTFELCSQIRDEIEWLLTQKPGRAAPADRVNTALLIGSVSLNRQIDGLKKTKPLVAVGNPGRLLVLAKMGKLRFQDLRFLVLDEADRLTAEESLEETRGLARLIEREVRGKGLTAAACSATVSEKSGELLAPLFAGAEFIASDAQEILRERIEHWAIFSEERKKVQTLRSLLAAIKTKKAGFKALVFAGGNDEAGNIVSQLQYHHIPASGLFGKMDKQNRKDAVDAFRAGKSRVLVSSDLAARGLDIAGISHVIALDVPADKEIYIHRAGRTGRAGKQGVMVSIGGEAEMRRLAVLEKKLGIIVRPRELYQGKITEP
ncbi:MAG: DEAD/DEAH box helicase [Treponema sp.]|jgi:superfamily II DNA/RNA helicase|nr:DEAD/DEAH box helicase [Treponema sp.]